MSGSIGGQWRSDLIALIALLGAGLVIRAIVLQFVGRAGRSKRSRLVVGLRGFRATVIGLALIGIAIAWRWDLTWLLVVSLGIAGEETFESSVMIWGLERERQRERPDRTSVAHRPAAAASR